MLYVHFSVAVDLCNSVTDVELLTVSVCPPKSTLKLSCFRRSPMPTGFADAQCNRMGALTR